MFADHTGWIEDPCYYVVASHAHRRAWLAGPYRGRAEADAALAPARRWALHTSGDRRAGEYAYEVFRHYNGHTHSILGPVGV